MFQSRERTARCKHLSSDEHNACGSLIPQLQLNGKQTHLNPLVCDGHLQAVVKAHAALGPWPAVEGRLEGTLFRTNPTEAIETGRQAAALFPTETRNAACVLGCGLARHSLQGPIHPALPRASPAEGGHARHVLADGHGAGEHVVNHAVDLWGGFSQRGAGGR